MTLDIFWMRFIREIDNLIKCQVPLSSLNQVMQLRDLFLTGLETLPMNLPTRAGKNQLNLVLGFLNKKDEEEDSKRIPLELKEGTTIDSVIHLINLEEQVSGKIRNYDRKWAEITTESLVINVIQKGYFWIFKVYLPR